MFSELLSIAVGVVVSPVAIAAVIALLMARGGSLTAVGFIVAKSISWLRPVEFRARWSGKAVTVLQMVTFAAVLKFPEYVSPLIWAVGVLSLFSVIDYTWALWKARAQ